MLWTHSVSLHVMETALNPLDALENGLLQPQEIRYDIIAELELVWASLRCSPCLVCRRGDGGDRKEGMQEPERGELRQVIPLVSPRIPSVPVAVTDESYREQTLASTACAYVFRV